MVMKTQIEDFSNMSIASGRPDAYESTHISRILRQEYIHNVHNDEFHSEVRM